MASRASTSCESAAVSFTCSPEGSREARHSCVEQQFLREARQARQKMRVRACRGRPSASRPFLCRAPRAHRSSVVIVKPCPGPACGGPVVVCSVPQELSEVPTGVRALGAAPGVSSAAYATRPLARQVATVSKTRATAPAADSEVGRSRKTGETQTHGGPGLQQPIAAFVGLAPPAGVKGRTQAASPPVSPCPLTTAVGAWVLRLSCEVQAHTTRVPCCAPCGVTASHTLSSCVLHRLRAGFRSSQAAVSVGSKLARRLRCRVGTAGTGQVHSHGHIEAVAGGRSSGSLWVEPQPVATPVACRDRPATKASSRSRSGTPRSPGFGGSTARAAQGRPKLLQMASRSRQKHRTSSPRALRSAPGGGCVSGRSTRVVPLGSSTCLAAVVPPTKPQPHPTAFSFLSRLARASYRCSVVSAVRWAVFGVCPDLCGHVFQCNVARFVSF